MTQDAPERDWTVPPNGFDTYREAAPHMRRPFAANAIRWRVVTGNMLVSYIDARTVIERLNALVPHLWQDRYEPYGGRIESGLLICHLTIGDLTRSDVGKRSATEGEKGAHSDSIKRAAVHFGVGVSLYAMARIYHPTGSGQSDKDGNPIPPLKAAGKTKQGKDRYALTPEVEKWLRSQYGRWLDTDRGKHFGPALDHGDEPDAIGEEPSEPVSEEPTASGDPDYLAAREAIEKAYADLPAATRKKLPPAQLKAQLDGADMASELEPVAKRIEGMKSNG